MSDNRWTLPENPPPPMFLGEKERNYAKQINDEIIERVVGQTVLYYPIDLKTTNFHALYGEAIEKSFLPPVRVYALVKWDGEETSTDLSVMDREATLTINFHRKRLTQDQNLFIREGDFILYASRYWEIVKLADPRLLFGQQEHKFEIRATCRKARQGLFEEPAELTRIQNLIIESEQATPEVVENIATCNGICLYDGDNSTFVDMYTNPANYSGRIIYLTSVGSTLVEPFSQAGKFYFNERGIWFPSPLFFG